MTIYTKTGDMGTTSLYGGKRVGKEDCNIACYGTLDELTSIIGWIRSGKLYKQDSGFLLQIQRNLYLIMALLSGYSGDIQELEENIRVMEKTIDILEKEQKPLKTFIIPGGGELSSRFHIARTVCRRAERSIVSFFMLKSILPKQKKATVLRYINRLSDLLFMMSRKYATNETVVRSI